MKSLRGIFVLSLALALAACVTSYDKPQHKIDEQKALDSHVQLGLGYIARGNRDSARKHFNKALKIDSNSAGALNGMGILYQMEGEVKLAEEYFEKSLRADRSYSQGRNNYGSFLFQQQRYEDAYKQFELAANDVDYSNRANALVNLGRTAEKIGRPEKAEAAFEQALRLDPVQPIALMELANIRFEQQDYAESKKYLTRFERSNPPSAASLWLGIRIERVFGNKDKEASYALKLKNLHPYSKEYLAYKNSQ